MSDLIVEASRGLMPFLAAGADGALGELTRQAGESTANAVRRLVDAIGGAIHGDKPTPVEVGSALESGLRDGSIAHADLVQMAEIHGAGRDNNGIQVKGNAYIGSSIRIDGGGSFNG